LVGPDQQDNADTPHQSNRQNKPDEPDKPVLIELIVLSLGLFLVVVNALLLELTAYLVTGFSVTGFWPAVGGSVVISLVTMILNVWTSDNRQTERDALPQRPPKIINPDE